MHERIRRIPYSLPTLLRLHRIHMLQHIILVSQLYNNLHSLNQICRMQPNRNQRRLCQQHTELINSLHTPRRRILRIDLARKHRVTKRPTIHPCVPLTIQISRIVTIAKHHIPLPQILAAPLTVLRVRCLIIQLAKILSRGTRIAQTIIDCPRLRLRRIPVIV